MTENKHWAFESEINLQTRIVSDFLAQIEEKMSDLDWTHSELANALGVTEGRVSQIFSCPDNLTIRTMVRIASAVGVLVSIVAYDPINKETGPIASRIFNLCWKDAGKPIICENDDE